MPPCTQYSSRPHMDGYMWVAAFNFTMISHRVLARVGRRAGITCQSTGAKQSRPDGIDDCKFFFLRGEGRIIEYLTLHPCILHTAISWP